MNHILFFFYSSCLRSWLEQDTSCPTCRKALSDSMERDYSSNMNDYGQNDILNREAPDSSSSQRNQYYHFEGKFESFLLHECNYLANGSGEGV